ncbi:FAD/NAD(P)-binding protein [bacterium]|nr:FAD/NAD(P)-binding protein [bacterium]
MTNCACASEPRNPYTPEPMRLIRRYPLTEDVNFFQVRAVDVSKAINLNYLPGQFMMVSLNGIGEAPFSISSTPSRPGLIEFGIRRVGNVTNHIFKMKENHIMGVRGPYGNGFPIEDMKGRDLVIVMGGLGAVPLRSLLLYALDNRDQFGKIYLLHGAKRPDDMLFKEEFFNMMTRDDLICHLTVDQDDTGAWPYETGLITRLFANLTDIDPNNTSFAVCGPPIMYKFVVAEILKLNVPKHQILMTLERRMKCGVGKCGHCSIGGYIYTCLEGPVFSYWDVIHMKGLI